jgi:uncharacterized protein DUF3168
MAGPLAPSTNLLFAGILKRWEQKAVDEVITGGIHEAEAPERTPRPYAVIDPVSEVPWHFTNAARYDEVVFQITVVTDFFEDGGVKASFITNALDFANLQLGLGAALFQCRPGPSHYMRERQLHKTVVEYKARVRRDVNYNPA